MSTPFLSIQGIHKAYGDVVAVHEVSIDVSEGEFLTFLGPSGSGKSTTLYILAGFEKPTNGDILLRGKTLLQTPSHKRNIGMVFQRYTLFPHLTVGENLAFPLRMRKEDTVTIARKVKDALDLVQLTGFEDRMPKNMSGGQQQRVALARALIYNPPILLMDEPLSALDKKLREELQTEIKRVHERTGVTVLYVTHDQEEALRMSDRIAIFKKGNIAQIGTGARLYNEPNSYFVASFMGDNNFLKARVRAINGATADLEIAGGIVVRNVPIRNRLGGNDAWLMIRPEHLTVSSALDGSLIDVTVRDVSFLGNSLEIGTETAEGEKLSVRARDSFGQIEKLKSGNRIKLSIDGSLAHAFGGID